MTQNNLNNLAQLSHVFIHPPEQGLLACGDSGEGKLPQIELVSEIIPLINTQQTKKHVLITTGATIAPLDPVRFLTNPSSGLTGYELAKTYLKEGHKVTLIYGHGSDKKIQYLKELPHCEIIQAQTTKEMLKTAGEYFDQCDIYISTAAMSDIEFNYTHEKVKKSSLTNSLKISKAPDVLKTLIKQKKSQKIVGFAAETHLTESMLAEKWKSKPVDLLIGNNVNNGTMGSPLGFGQNNNEYLFYKDGQLIDKKLLSKSQLAQKIMEQFND